MKNLTLAGCIILDVHGSILLIHRNSPKRTQWEIPGGKVEDGEDPVDAAIREVKEEIGVEVEIIKELGRKEFKEDQFIMDYIWFLATVESGEPQITEQKYDDFKYFSWEELQSMKDLSPNTQNFVEAYFSKKIDLS